MSKPISKPFARSVTPFLWFDSAAEEAAKTYTSLFADSRIVDVSRAGDRVQSATIVLAGQRYILFNGGPHYTLDAAFSMMVQVETQDELDAIWDALIAGGKPSRCGWLVDRFGVSWQVVPTMLPRLLGDPDPAKAKRALDAMLGMQKLDIDALTRAHAGG
jgi:predicted 3-demethylubiquinone-9 3-methyltransferase (glyoxalase superfamily)